MTARRDLAIWVVVLAGLLGFLWLLSGILLPFVLGMAIAYVVDPVVARQVFEDFQQDDDPEKPRTSDLPYPYMVQGPVDPAAVACPDPGTLAQAVQGATLIDVRRQPAFEQDPDAYLKRETRC